MAINFPEDRTEVTDRVKTNVKSNLPNSDPFLPNAYIGALCAGFGGVQFDLYLQLQEILKQMFPDSATGLYAQRWGSYVGFTKIPAGAADGKVVLTGTVGTVLDIDSLLISGDGQNYGTTESAEISEVLISIGSLTRAANIVTAVTTSAHYLASGLTISISGADQSGYNGTYIITTISSTAFTYSIETEPATPATGTILAGYNGAVVSVISEGVGEAANQFSGASLTLATPVSGINNNALVYFDGISHGVDEEKDEDFKKRYLFRYRNIHAEFNKNDIISKAKEIPGVTRVWVREITPEVGDVTINFTRDNDSNNIPDSVAVSDVKTRILTIKPAFADDSQVHVYAPDPILTNFTFTALSPNTREMRQAINENLDFFFRDSVNVGENIVSDSYRSVIYQTTDSTGAVISSFTLSSPSGDVAISAGEIGTFEPENTVFPS